MDTRTDTSPPGHRILLAASAGLLIAVGLHGLDHALQDRGIWALTTEVLVGGLVNAAAAALVFVLALRADPRAPMAAAGIGAYLALGVTAAHFAPHWSAFSDPYADLDLGVLSWAAAAFEVACAAVLAAVGVAVLRRRRTTSRLALS
jgi:hypothetical protein